MARLILARTRRRPGRWLLAAAGIGLAAAFAGAVAVESTLAADRGAQAALAAAGDTGRAVRVTATDPAQLRAARALLAGLGLRDQATVLLLNPVRLGGVVVRPAAIDPLGEFVGGRAPGPCRTASCPMLLAGGRLGRWPLRDAGVRLSAAARGTIRSAVPLGFVPEYGQMPLLVTGDVRGLAAVAGLAGVFRTVTLIGALRAGALHAWQLPGFERRLAAVQAQLGASSAGGVTVTAPFDALDRARAIADATPRRLLPAGGGALAALALFVVLAAGARRSELRRELGRLRVGGATRGQAAAFVIGEAALVCAVGLVLGAALAVASGAVLVHAAGAPAGTVLAHSLLRPAAAAVTVGAWVAATALVTATVLGEDRRLLDALALAAIAALALALTRSGPDDALAALFAPLGCLAAGVLVFRACGAALGGLERALRRGPPLLRIAVLGLARAPGGPALAVAFVAVAAGLAGFGLSYRATLRRSAADQAAQQVPLDALVDRGAGTSSPLQLTPMARWRTLSGGRVFAVRRTDASFASGGATATVTALGVPAAAITELRGWRAADGSAPLPSLAARLRPEGPARIAGPSLDPGARWLSVRAAASGAEVEIAAELRGADGGVRELALGTAGTAGRTLRARLPRGRYELEAFGLSETAGLAATSGHQSAENAAPPGAGAARLTLGPVLVGGARAGRGPVGGARPARYSLAGWRAVGAARWAHAARGALTLEFALDGAPGVLRPEQPSDGRPVPVLTDPATAAAATPDGRLALTVDGIPVAARVVATARRFPTVDGGFVVADAATLAGALDAGLPGQGRADELWISGRRLEGLRAALAGPRLGGLGGRYRASIARALGDAPIAVAASGTLLAAGLLAAALAALGVWLTLLGSGRDARLELDLLGAGLGPQRLAAELRLRLLVAAAAGIGCGVAIAAALARLAVGAVGAAGAVANPRPPVVMVLPWGQLAALVAALAVALAAVATLGARAVAGRTAA